MFNNTKNFGFITPSDGGIDLFFVAQNCIPEDRKKLRENVQVEFDKTLGPKGNTVTNITVGY